MCKFFAVSRSGYYAFVHRLGKPELVGTKPAGLRPAKSVYSAIVGTDYGGGYVQMIELDMSANREVNNLYDRR